MCERTSSATVAASLERFVASCLMAAISCSSCAASESSASMAAETASIALIAEQPASYAIGPMCVAAAARSKVFKVLGDSSSSSTSTCGTLPSSL